MGVIVASGPEEFNSKKEKFIESGIGKIHVLADFDRTLTKAFVDGEKTPSVIAELRRKNYISEEYSKKATELSEIYRPIEMDLSVSHKEKKEKMKEWWEKHFDLLIESGLNKKHIVEIVESGKIKLREGADEFFELLKKNKIPLIIMSSAGLGIESISMALEKEGKLSENVHIISNSFEWNSEGKAISVKKPIIHGMNKAEVSLKELPIYDELLEKKNVILLGDSLGDLGMIEGFPYDNLIKIGFLNYNVEANLEKFKENFDVVITDDGDLEFVNNFLKEVINIK
jgi:5'-nucleotidase